MFEIVFLGDNHQPLVRFEVGFQLYSVKFIGWSWLTKIRKHFEPQVFLVNKLNKYHLSSLLEANPIDSLKI